MGDAQAENSEVLLFASVAVAVIIGPVTEVFGTEKVKLALQETSVVVFVKPRNVWPWPLPEGSQVVFAKNSILNCVFAVLFKIPWIVVVVEFVTAEVRTGKFCKLLGPVSLSQLSFAVTKTGDKSIPSRPFAEIELPRIAFPVPLLTETPGPAANVPSKPNSKPQLAMLFPAPAVVPPILLLDAPLEIPTPPSPFWVMRFP